MRPVALEPFFAPDTTGALETLEALATSRLVFRSDLETYAARVGLNHELLDVWTGLGLVHAGKAVLDAAEGEMAEVLVLTPKGAKELSRAVGRVMKGQSAVRVKRNGAKLAHDASVGGAALAILTAAREQGLDLRGITTDDKQLGMSGVVQVGADVERVPLQADGYALTHDGEVHRGVLLELDRGTTAPKRLASKFAAYAAWAREDGPDRTFAVKAIRVLHLVTDERRLERLRETCLESVGRPSGMFLFALTSNVSVKEPEKLFEPIAKMLSGEMVPIFTKPSGSAATGTGTTPRPVRDGEAFFAPAISIASARTPIMSSPARCSPTPCGLQ
ncbi:MAG: replication-relaxation family protein [Polyangiaceae bacterium]